VQTGHKQALRLINDLTTRRGAEQRPRRLWQVVAVAPLLKTERVYDASSRNWHTALVHDRRLSSVSMYPLSTHFLLSTVKLMYAAVQAKCAARNSVVLTLSQ